MRPMENLADIYILNVRSVKQNMIFTMDQIQLRRESRNGKNKQI